MAAAGKMADNHSVPTLAPMPDRAPADILEAAPPPPLSWWIGRTLPRQEKKLARWLARQHCPYFLPMRRRVRNWRGRRIKSEEPLLAGYVFFFAPKVDAAFAWRSGALAGMLCADDQEGLRNELLALDRLAALDRELHERPGLVEGREVEVRAGALKGLRGVIVPSNRLVIRLAILGRQLEVPLDPAEVEPIW